MGTYVKVHLSGAVSEGDLLDCSTRVFEEINRIEATMSFHDPTSELSKINREAHLHPIRISQDMDKVLSLAIDLSRATRGVFDIAIAPELVKRGLLPAQDRPLPDRSRWASIQLSGGSVHFDVPLLLALGGIAKGFAVDCALSVLPPEIHAEINAGGDLRMTSWKGEQVLVRMPGHFHRALRVPMLRAAIATSGAYFLEGEYHIIHPHTKKPIDEHRSISVFAPTCMLADALTKVAWIGESSEPILKGYNACALLVDEAGECQWVGED